MMLLHNQPPPQADGHQTNSPVGFASLLTFKVGGQLYGAPVDKVIRIIEMVTITHLPEAPETIQGLINLHGQPVPVMDLHLRFGLPRPAYGLHTPIVLVDAAAEDGPPRPLGLVVDSVQQVVESPDLFREPAVAQLPASYLLGVVKLQRQMLLLLNIPALLRPAELASLAATMVEG
jgi:purine-binding chemotaxis protein CheW